MDIYKTDTITSDQSVSGNHGSEEGTPHSPKAPEVEPYHQMVKCHMQDACVE